VEVWLGSARAMVRVVGGGLVDFWGLQCRVVAEAVEVVGSICCVVVMVAGYEGCHLTAEVVRE
jgi:hypothetical protein